LETVVLPQPDFPEIAMMVAPTYLLHVAQLLTNIL
jgi:hypothetical protein